MRHVLAAAALALVACDDMLPPQVAPTGPAVTMAPARAPAAPPPAASFWGDPPAAPVDPPETTADERDRAERLRQCRHVVDQAGAQPSGGDVEWIDRWSCASSRAKREAERPDVAAAMNAYADRVHWVDEHCRRTPQTLQADDPEVQAWPGGDVEVSRPTIYAAHPPRICPAGTPKDLDAFARAGMPAPPEREQAQHDKACMWRDAEHDRCAAMLGDGGAPR